MTRRTTPIAAMLAMLATAPVAQAQDDSSVLIYLGAGTNLDAEQLDGDTPFTFGVLSLSDSRPSVFGFDFAREGQMLDSTFGTEAVRQAVSANLVVGYNIYNDTALRADGSLLLGFRESFADCPDSFLGFQCYADRAPDTEYTSNLGAMFNVTFQSVSLGVRATEASTQAIVGLRF